MYEIPPSVDKYLGISSKSMIHFPVASWESSFESSLSALNDDILTKKHLIANGSEEDDGRYIDDAAAARRKRRFEDYNEEGQQSPKRFKIDRANLLADEVNSCSTGCQSIDNATTLAPVQRQHTIDHVISNGQINHHTEPYSRKLPELRPKALNGVAAQTNWGFSNSKGSTRKNPWGPQSYSELISGAISASHGHRASLQQIYEWIVTNVSWFSDKADYPSTKGWKVRP